jgi:hypothetical protein
MKRIQPISMQTSKGFSIMLSSGLRGEVNA